MKSPALRFSLRRSMVAVALLGLLAAGVRSLLPPPPEAPITEGARLRVPAVAGSVTAVGVFHRTPPPWPSGNCFTLSPRPRRAGRHSFQEPHVANMHFENFREVVRRLSLKAVEVEYRGGCLLVVDPRIPRRWLRDR